LRRAALLALLLALPAEARRHHAPKKAAPPPARAEDDPRKKGDSPAFAKAALSFAAPHDLAQLGEGAPVRIDLHVAGYALGPLQAGGPTPHAHLIVDNEPAMEIDAAQPVLLSGLSRGPHLLRAVLCRPWHEVVKAPHAFALTRFWIGPPVPGKAGKAAEYVAWPDPRKPILTYVLPLGQPPASLKLVREAPAEEEDPTEAKEPDPPADPAPRQDKPVLDFYLSNGRLARRGDKLRIVLDKRELPLIVEWKPQRLRRAHRGTHKVTIDLLNRRGLKVKNAVNRTDRLFTTR